MTYESVAEALLGLLKERGVNRLFVNGGTDFASIVEAYGRASIVEAYGRRDGAELDFPEVVVCAHENLAISMAHGAYLGDGTVPAVMLHTSVGTANAVCGVFSAARGRIPVILTAGRTPLFEGSVFGSRDIGIHWAQEMYDQGGMLRELVKWDYELRDGVQVEQVVDRALSLALTEPRGPVYLTLPREVLARPGAGIDPAAPAPVVPTSAHPDPVAVAALADHLASARLPVIVTSQTGADQRTVALLNEVCSEYAIAVAEHGPRYLNVSADHPMHLGYAIGPVLAEADVACFLDVDVPWSPGASDPSADTVVIQCGVDPLFSRYPIRSHRSDLSITATPRALLEALSAALAQRAATIDRSRADRIAELAHGWRGRQQATTEAELAAPGPITKLFLNAALRQVLTPQTVVVNEYWAQPQILGQSEPGSYFGPTPAGGLGWGLPAALGVQLARPGQTVIATLGDGSYLFANPAACHHAMAMYDLPVLTVVCANAKWAAVENSAMRMYPDGHAAAAGELTPLARLDPVPAFEKYAEASGGHGEAVSERADLVPALRRALRVVREERRHALVNVRCA